ncbi:MAG: FG-GAP-like repeat-containing protein [Janthinobacterium lividum]
MKQLFLLARLCGLALLLPLLAHAGTPVLTLQATVPTSSTDVTAFVDKVEILNVATGAVVASAVPNSSFETIGTVSSGGYGYNPTGASWTFTNQSGITASGNAFACPTPPDGSYAAFLQTSNTGLPGSFSQTLPTLAAGYYQVRVRLAQRNTNAANQGVLILVDGLVLGSSVPANDGAFHVFTSAVFAVDKLTLRFEGTGSATAGADVTAFVDVVQVLNASGTAVAGAVLNSGFETVDAYSGSFTQSPTGAIWAFGGQGGIANSNSAYSNPATSPDGTHIALLQNVSSFSQGLAGLAAGSYQVRAQLGQRNYSAANQDVRILVGGVALGTNIPANDNAYHAYTTGSFLVTPPVITGISAASAVAGASITLTGNYLGGAAYVSVDGVAVVPASASSTSLTFTVPAGVSASPSIIVTSPYGPSNAIVPQLNVVSTSPAANSRTAPLANSTVGVTFSGPVTAASAAGLRVFSAQLGGRKAGTVSVNSNTASFAATTGTVRTNFKPGELVSVTVPATVQNSSGQATRKKVYQFSTATGGTGTGTFRAPAANTDPAVGTYPLSVALGDIDGDGDLDVVTANDSSPGTVSLVLNGGDATGSNTGSFAGGTTLSVSDYPMGLALGDVNGDGSLDILTASYGGNIGVRLNNGSATSFTTPATVPTVGTNPQSLTLGDIDGDGDLDLVTANSNNPGTVSVRFNDGAGTFTAPASGAEVAVGSNPQNALLGDVDGDGDLDLLAVNQTSGTVSVRLNDGTGLFAAPAIGAEVTVSTAAQGLALGDVDGDGDLDLVATSYVTAGVVSLRLNDGAGLFTAPAANADTSVGNGPRNVVLADVDADGDLDMLAVNRNGNNVSVRLNNGSGTFTALPANSDPAAAGLPYALALGDVDGDGDLDLVAANGNTPGTVSVRLNQPPVPVISSFSLASGVAGTSVKLTGTSLTGTNKVTVNGVSVTPTSVTATDLFFVVPAGASPTQSITVTSPNGTSLPSTAFTVLLRIAGTSPVANVRNATPLTNSAVSVTFSEPVTAASTAPTATSGLKVYSAQAGGRKAGTLTLSGNTASFAATASTPRTDFKPGEVVSVSVPATVLSAGGLSVPKRVLQFTTATGGPGKGLFSASATSPSAGTYAQSVALGDVDGDGDLDMATTNQDDGTVSVRLNGGDATGTNTGSFTAGSTVTVGSNPRSVVLADIDGDGDLDLLAANNGGNTVSVRVNNGSGAFSGSVNQVVGSNPYAVALADVDGDGDLDLLTTSYGSSQVSILLNGGDATGSNSGAFSNGSTISVDSAPTGLAMGDVDGDGDLDLVVVCTASSASTGSGSVNVRLNGGDATGSNTGVFSNGSAFASIAPYPLTVALGDVDGDGDLDLLTAGYSGTVGTSLANVRLNGGNATAGTLNAGTFSNGSNVGVDSAPYAVALADVDGDGDLDLLASSSNGSTVSVRLNGGDATGTSPGTFSNGSDVSVGSNPQGLGLGDVDGDGDLDLLATIPTHSGANPVSVRLNQAPPPTIVSFTPVSGIVGSTFSLTGTNLLGATKVTFAGTSGNVATSFTVASSTSLTNIVVPGGAQTGTLTVTTGGGTSAASTQTFTVVPPPVISSFSSASAGAGTSIVLTGTGLTGATKVTVNGVSVTPTNVGSTSLTFVVPAGASTTQSITVTSPNGTSAASTAFTVRVGVVPGTPAANARTAPLAGSATSVTFTEPVTAASLASTATGGLKVYSAQVGGRKAGTVSLNGSTASFAATAGTLRTDFRAGELVSVTVPGTVQATGGLLAKKRVYQFTTATNPIGAGIFGSGSSPSMGSSPQGVAVGDVDGDGDLDLVTGNNYGSVVSVRLNGGNSTGSNTGVYGAATTVTVGNSPQNVALADVDGDGDLDLVAANNNTSTVSVVLNGGDNTGSNTGTFTGGSTVSVAAFPRRLVLADIDGDGDLDLLTIHNNSTTVSIRLNGGDATGSNTGIFSGTGTATAGGYAAGLALGDVDGDGDLDLLTANNDNTGSNGTVSVLLNGGDASGSNAGTFSGGSTVSVGQFPYHVALGDVDGDGDLDLLTANRLNTTGTVSIRLNGGDATAATLNAGTFGNGSSVNVGTTPQSLALGDVDGDGDLDVVASNYDSNGPTTVSVRLNGGSAASVNAGTFSNGSDPTVSGAPLDLALGDVDGDGDLDIVTVSSSSASVRLNLPAVPTIASFTPASGPVGTVISLMGTNLLGATKVTFAGTASNVATGFTVASSTSLTGIVVPSGAATGTLTVTTAGGTSAASTQTFTVTPTPVISSFSPTSGVAGASVVLSGSNLANATSVTVNGVSVTPTNVSSTGLTFVVPAGASNTQSIRVTVSGGASVTSTAFTVRLPVTGTSPAANAHTAPLANSAVSVTFSEPVTAGTAAVQVFSAQAGGRKAGTVSLNAAGTTASFTAPTGTVRTNFRAGELVSVTVPATVLGAGGLAVSKKVFQFATAVSGVGRGTFAAPATPEVSLGNNPRSVAVGDVNGDGNLDMVVASYSTTTYPNSPVSIRLGDGAGGFSGSQTVNVDANPTVLVLGDLDGDGDLDLVTANENTSLSIRLNDGLGNFSGTLNLNTFNANITPMSVALGDLDGDGDLDIVAGTSNGTILLRFNAGNATFNTGAVNISRGSSPQSVALGDVDNDGALDLLTVNNASSGFLSVSLGDGNGNFGSSKPGVSVGSNPRSLVLGDVDGDGDLDAVTANNYNTNGSSTASVRLNDGAGNFGGGSDPSVGPNAYDVALGDVDADGDLDLLVASNGNSPNSVSVRLNAGTGTFSGGSDPRVGDSPQSLVLGDLDNDGDLDLLTANFYGNSVSVRLNTCVPTLAVTSVPATLGRKARVAVAASAFVGSNTTTCGQPLTVQVQQGQSYSVSATESEGNTLVLTPPLAGGTFTAVTFASYGTPGGSPGSYTVNSGCHDGNSQAIVESYVLGQSGTVYIPVDNNTFTDNCPGTAKYLSVTATYSVLGAASDSVRFSCAEVGTQPVQVVLTVGGTTTTLASSVVVSAPAPAALTTWLGLAGTDWNDCRNWSFGQVPDATTSVMVPAGRPNYPSLPAGTYPVIGLTVQAGSTLSTDPGATLQVSGNFANNGTATLQGPVQFVGSAAQTLGGSSATAFATVEVNKPGGAVQLGRDLAIGTALTLTSGTLSTGSYRVVLDPAATLTETDQSYVSGQVATTRPLLAGTAETFGGLGLTLTPAASSVAPGSTAVVRTTGTALSGVGNGASVQRYFSIEPTTNSGLNVNMDFAYFEHERNSLAANRLSLFKSVKSTGGPWQSQGAVSRSSYTVSKTGITDFSLWTLGIADAPLPVQLTTFTATAEGTAAVRLAWATASELNSAYFEAERSLDGIAFGRIGQVPAAGSSATAHTYTLPDAALPAGASLLYYRLRQVDLDGTFTYSAVRVVPLTNRAGLVLFPNPTTRAATLTGTAPGTAVQVFDALGRLVTTATADATGTAALVLPPGLASGVYTVRAGASALRLTVE